MKSVQAQRRGDGVGRPGARGRLDVERLEPRLALSAMSAAPRLHPNEDPAFERLVTQRWTAHDLTINWTDPEGHSGSMKPSRNIVTVGTDDAGNVLTVQCPSGSWVTPVGTFTGEIEIERIGGRIDPRTGQGVMMADGIFWQFIADFTIGGVPLLEREATAQLGRDRTHGDMSLTPIVPSAGPDVFSFNAVGVMMDRPPLSPDQQLILAVVNNLPDFKGMVTEGSVVSWEIDLNRTPTPVRPPQPEAPHVARSFDTGLDPSDGVTLALRPVITGATEPGLPVKVLIDGQVAGRTKADALGAYAFRPAAKLAEGVHAVAVRAIGDNGKASLKSPATAFTVDRTPPRVEVVSGPVDTAGMAFVPRPGDSFQIVVTMSERVAVAGKAFLPVRIGRTRTWATYAGSDDCVHLRFTASPVPSAAGEIRAPHRLVAAPGGSGAPPHVVDVAGNRIVSAVGAWRGR